MLLYFINYSFISTQAGCREQMGRDASVFLCTAMDGKAIRNHIQSIFILYFLNDSPAISSLTTSSHFMQAV